MEPKRGPNEKNKSWTEAFQSHDSHHWKVKVSLNPLKESLLRFRFPCSTLTKKHYFKDTSVPIVFFQREAPETIVHKLWLQ